MVSLVLAVKKAHVLVFNTAHVLRRNKAEVLAVNKAHVLCHNNKIYAMFRANSKEAASGCLTKWGWRTSDKYFFHVLFLHSAIVTQGFYRLYPSVQ